MTALNSTGCGDVLDVIEFAIKAINREQPTALCIVTSVNGGTLRDKGAMMAVTSSGQIAGYISNGCIDGDIAFQAAQALQSGSPRRLRYGEGSPFIDIRLPCGGAIEVTVLPNPEPGVVSQLLKSLVKRRPIGLGVSESSLSVFDPDHEPEDKFYFTHIYSPRLLLRIAGSGPAVTALAQTASLSAFDVLIQSPDIELKGQIPDVKFDLLAHPDDVLGANDDMWTAVVLLFHDHDWELPLLEQALAGPAFYIGAMGSARTQAIRQERLIEAGASPKNIARIHGPIGLTPQLRDANLLALSILAEIMQTARSANLI